ncbi:MAG: hypothetical protein AAF824_01240 [Bacteroidota bacterium]
MFYRNKVLANNRHRSILFIWFLSFSSALPAQILPSEWIGKWEGTVDIWSYNEKTYSFPMSLDVQQGDSALRFTINYMGDPEKPDIRKYQLIMVDSAKFHLAIDEQNSILLDSYYNGGCLYNRFAVELTDIQMRICLEGESMSYELISTANEAVRTSGGEIMENDTIPDVFSYEVMQVMKAKLAK